MRLSHFSCAALLPLALWAVACTNSIQVGNDGSGGDATSSGGGLPGSGGQGAGSGGAGASTSSATGGSGSGGGDVAQLGEQCGGFVMHPRTCGTGLVCVTTGEPDAPGTCAMQGQTVSGVGGPCGGTVPAPAPICQWNLVCQGGSGDTPGTCVDPSSAGCPGAMITVEGDGPTRAYRFACKDSYGAPYSSEANGHVGYEKPLSVDPNQKEQLWLSGCATANAPPLAGSISIEAPQPVVGTTTTGNAEYDDGTDTYATDTDVTVTVTSIDGTTIKGAYTANVTTVNNGVKTISGSFAVCHVMDFFPP